jgi:hypothetical protein
VYTGIYPEGLRETANDFSRIRRRPVKIRTEHVSNVSRTVILNGCAARFARCAARFARRAGRSARCAGRFARCAARFARRAGRFARCAARFARCARRFARCAARFARRAGRFARCAARFARCAGRFARCVARFARRAAKLSRRCDVEKTIKIVSVNINFEKGTREKCSRALTNLFSRGFIGLNQRVQ